MDCNLEGGSAAERLDAFREQIRVHHQRRPVDDAAVVQKTDRAVRLRTQNEIVRGDDNRLLTLRRTDSSWAHVDTSTVYRCSSCSLSNANSTARQPITDSRSLDHCATPRSLRSLPTLTSALANHDQCASSTVRQEVRMAGRSVPLIGSIEKVGPADAARLAAYVVRGHQVLAQAPIQATGAFHVNLSRAAVEAKSPYGLSLVIAPAGAGDHLEHVADAPRIALDRHALAKADNDYRLSQKIAISDASLKTWWKFCIQYCVSGTLVGPNGCVVPGADVTVYTVTYGSGGYTKVPRATVTTGPDGTFTACFPWCRCIFCFPCWPCWPFWWNCWPWWWEYDILHVIEAIERQPVPVGPGPVERLPNLGLFKPDSRALMRGEGFAAARTPRATAQDPARTALIRSKLASSRIK